MPHQTRHLAMRKFWLIKRSRRRQWRAALNGVAWQTQTVGNTPPHHPLPTAWQLWTEPIHLWVGPVFSFFFLSLVEHAHKSSVTLSWWFRVINRQLFRRLVYIWGVRLIVATTHTHTHSLTHTLCLSHMCINAFSNCPSPKNAAYFLAINQTISREHHQRVCDCVLVCMWASVCGANL